MKLDSNNYNEIQRSMLILQAILFEEYKLFNRIQIYLGFFL